MNAPVIWMRSDLPPFPRLARLRASNIHRAYQLMQGSQATFDVPRDSSLSAEVMRPGNVVEIVGSTSRRWIGVLKAPSEDLAGAYENWIAEDLFTQLSERSIPATTYLSYAAGAIFNDLVNYAQRNSPMSMSLFPATPLGASISASIAAQALSAAIDQLAQDSGWEVTVRPGYLGPALLDPTIQWVYRCGVDVSSTVAIYPVHMAKGIYSLDAKGTPAGVKVVSDQTFDVTAQRAAPIGTSASIVQSQSTAAFSPGMAAMLTLTDPTITTQQGATRQLLLPEYGSESFALTLNTRFDWASIDVGSYVRVHAKARHGNKVVRTMRVIGLQPDEEAGEMDVILNQTESWNDLRGAA